MSKRPYKMRGPVETIQVAQDILTKHDIQVEEKNWFTPHPNLFSVHIETSKELGCFGTNGKGVTREYALASAYGEFLERLQNGFVAKTAFSRTILKEIYDKTGYYYFPDEVQISRQNLMDLPNKILEDLFGVLDAEQSINRYFSRLAVNGYSGPISVPFINLSNGDSVLLPYNLLVALTGSNGMCAGNTFAEAVCQGICELLERYAASIIFYHKLCPPNIPMEVLQEFPDECEIIKDIEKRSGFKITVKSFETLMGLPVLGIILTDHQRNIYKLNVGCDRSFPVALQRCLTEIYQGIHGDKRMREVMIPIPNQDPTWMAKEDEWSVWRKREEFTNFCTDGRGSFPSRLFGDTPDYQFSLSSFGEGDSFEADVTSLVTKIHEIGSEVYVRDSSHMGFPAYWVYIPGFILCGNHMNEQFPVNSTSRAINFDSVEDLLFCSNNTHSRNIEALCRTLSLLPSNSTMHAISKVETCQGVWENIPLSFLRTLLFSSIGDTANARTNFEEFKNGMGNTDKLNCIDELISGERSLDDSLSFIRLPQCPNCKECDLHHDCTTEGKIHLYLKAFAKN